MGWPYGSSRGNEPMSTQQAPLSAARAGIYKAQINSLLYSHTPIISELCNAQVPQILIFHWLGTNHVTWFWDRIGGRGLKLSDW